MLRTSSRSVQRAGMARGIATSQMAYAGTTTAAATPATAATAVPSTATGAAPVAATPLPPNVKVVSSYVLPAPGSMVSDADAAVLRAHAHGGPLALARRLWNEYRESFHRKINEPVTVFKEAYGTTIDAVYNRWKSRVLIYGRIKPRPASTVVQTFSPDTDLQSFTILNDNGFGGTSTCELELRERDIVNEVTGAVEKRYSLVFKGELRMLLPFQKQSELQAGRRTKPLPPHKPLANTPPAQSASQTTSAAAAAAAPTEMRMSSRPPTLSSHPSHLAAVVAAASSVPSSTSSSNPAADAPAPSSSSSLADTPANPFLRVTESSQQTFLKHKQQQQQQQTSQRQSQPQQPQQQEEEVAKDATSGEKLSLGRRLVQAVSQPAGAARDERDPINGFAALILPFEYPRMNLEFCDFISMQVRTDGRGYMFNVRARDGVWNDSQGLVWQARIKPEVPRPMHKLEVRFENLICTQNGRPQNFGSQLPQDRVQSMGFSVTGPPGPFEIEIESISGETGTPEFETKMRLAAAQAEADERARRLQRKVADFDKRKAVQEELAKLRAERAVSASASGGTNAFDGAVARRLMTENLRRASANQPDAPVDTSAFPIEFQQQLEQDQKNMQISARQLARQQQQEKEMMAAQQIITPSTSTGAAAATPASAAAASTSARRPTRSALEQAELEFEVDAELSEEKQAKETPFGFGGRGSAGR